MSALAKLDEIDARLAAATVDVEHTGSGSPPSQCPKCRSELAIFELRGRAPADLALLSRLMRAAIRVPCLMLGRGAMQHCECIPCGIRRELGDGR